MTSPSVGAPQACAVRPADFSATLKPYRSLSQGGFAVLLAFVASILFAVGVGFFLLGAWPVLGFLGLDLLLIYWAFKANYRAARAEETIVIGEAKLIVRRKAANGRTRQWSANPYWVRVETERSEDEGCTALALVTKGERLGVGAFLSAPERGELAAMLRDALARHKAQRFPPAQVPAD